MAEFYVSVAPESAIADQPLQVYASNWKEFATGGACGGFPPIWSNAGPGDLAVKWVLQHAPPNTKNFSKCKQRAWVYNSVSISYMKVSKNFTDSTPCGTGLYRNVSKAKYRDGNNVWHHGSQKTQAILP